MSAPRIERTVLDFLNAKFDEAQGHLCVWLKRANATRAFPARALESAAAFIERASKTDDVYVAISTQTEPPQGRKRGGAATVSSLTGLFADIDFADAKGAQTGYPKTEEQALEILSSFPIRPTSIVHSGNGLQVHFDFDAPWLLRSSADRASAARLSARFQDALLAHFREHGHKIDSVGDIVRNFRPPGTLNHKSDPPKAVRLIEHDPSRQYRVEEFQDLVKTRARARTAGQPTAPPADHSKIVEGCAWYRTVVVEGAETCSEPDWFAGASIAALCKSGEAAFFDYSRRHPDFNEREARDKFRRAVKSNAPRTCASVADDLGHRDLCHACQHQGRITSPIQLGRVASAQPKGLNDRNVTSEFSMTDRGLLHHKPKGNSVVTVLVSGPFEVLGLARDEKSSGWSRYLRWRDADGDEHKYLASNKVLLTDHDAV